MKKLTDRISKGAPASQAIRPLQVQFPEPRAYLVDITMYSGGNRVIVQGLTYKFIPEQVYTPHAPLKSYFAKTPNEPKTS